MARTAAASGRHKVSDDRHVCALQHNRSADVAEGPVTPFGNRSVNVRSGSRTGLAVQPRYGSAADRRRWRGVGRYVSITVVSYGKSESLKFCMPTHDAGPKRGGPR